jgi:hypothetical protein
MSVREVSFTLTPEDLLEGLRAVHLARVRRLRGNPGFFLLSVVLAGSCLWWPVTRAFAALVGPEGATALFLIAMGIAAPIAYLVRRSVGPRPMLPGLMEWSLRRQLAAALKRSVLGPIVVRLSDVGLWRKNERDEVTILPAQVRQVLESEACVVVHVRTGRILVVPVRACAPEGVTALAEAIARVVGQPVTRVQRVP